MKNLSVLLLVMAAGLAQGGFPDTVPVGNPGNEADTTTFGAVAYEYRIGKYEVTSAQYCEFLNAVAKTDTYGLYDTNMGGEYGGITRSGAFGKYTYAVKDGMGNKPVNFVSWYDALRYANWLTGGQGKGGTETGSYTFTREGGGWKVTMPDHAALAAGKAVKWVLASNPPTFQFCNYGFRVVALGGAPSRSATSAGAPKAVAPAEIAAAPKRTTPASYYVSRSSGNDSWTGDAPSAQGTRGPWKTLARASIDCVPGDRILLKCGDTWNEELHPKGSGTPKNPITIGSYGKGRKPVIDRQDYRRDLFGIHLADQAGYKIVGIEFNRCMTGIYAEYSDGSPTRRFIWIEDCYFHDSLLYQHYEDYPKRKIGLGVCFFSHERDNKIVLADITIKNCVFRRLASGVWTNSPDNFNKNASYIYNFGNMTFEGCLFEEGFQWQLGLRGVAGGAVRNCVTHDIGRRFRSFNGVAGAMFFRCKNWVFEDSEWGFIDIGLGSADGEAFDFEGNCDNMTMRNCLFHDTDGPGFLLCCYASDGHPNRGIRMENCVLNGKAKRPIGLPRCEIINTTDWNEVTWRKCRFYLSKGEVLMRVMDPEKEKRSTFVDCLVKNLSDACSTPNLAAKATTSASSQEAGSEAAKAIDRTAATSWKATASTDQWLQLDFPKPTTVNELRIKEAPSSSIIRYVIECWDDKTARWVGCFNGRAIGPDFIAPIVSRTTRKVRLFIARTTSGNPCIGEFEVYNDTTSRPPNRASRQPGR